MSKSWLDVPQLRTQYIIENMIVGETRILCGCQVTRTERGQYRVGDRRYGHTGATDPATLRSVQNAVVRILLASEEVA